MTTTISAERPDSPDALALITELDDHLIPQYPIESHHGFDVGKLIAQSVAFFVLRHDGVAAGCGGIKLFGSEYGEIKRMYVRPQFRGQRFGELILEHLERYALAHGVTCLRLETGIYQTGAIRLYQRVGFRPIAPFGEYQEDPNSLFFEKRLG
ncbi:MAG: GNAT family N-acetyltransferase [Roseiflexaceae bacterium]